MPVVGGLGGAIDHRVIMPHLPVAHPACIGPACAGGQWCEQDPFHVDTVARVRRERVHREAFAVGQHLRAAIVAGRGMHWTRSPPGRRRPWASCLPSWTSHLSMRTRTLGDQGLCLPASSQDHRLRFAEFPLARSTHMPTSSTYPQASSVHRLNRLGWPDADPPSGSGTGRAGFLGDLINRHDAKRLCRDTAGRLLRQMVGTVQAPARSGLLTPWFGAASAGQVR